MTITQLVIVSILATVATPLPVLLIPRTRQSPAFDRVLWIGTWLLALFGGLVAPSYLGTDGYLNSVMVADVAVVPALIGVVAGALSVNILLWLLDRYESPSSQEFDSPDSTHRYEEENDDANPNDSTKP